MYIRLCLCIPIPTLKNQWGFGGNVCALHILKRFTLHTHYLRKWRLWNGEWRCWGIRHLQSAQIPGSHPRQSFNVSFIMLDCYCPTLHFLQFHCSVNEKLANTPSCHILCSSLTMHCSSPICQKIKMGFCAHTNTHTHTHTHTCKNIQAHNCANGNKRTHRNACTAAEKQQDASTQTCIRAYDYYIQVHTKKSWTHSNTRIIV